MSTVIRINFYFQFFSDRLKTNYTQISDKEMARRRNIMDLPPEILEMIFKNLHSIKDMASCNNTCTLWKNVIEPMFKDKGTVTET